VFSVRYALGKKPTVSAQLHVPVAYLGESDMNRGGTHRPSGYSSEDETLCPFRISNPGLLASSLVNILAELARLHIVSEE
jgi:hypothetical protein